MNYTTEKGSVFIEMLHSEELIELFRKKLNDYEHPHRQLEALSYLRPVFGLTPPYKKDEGKKVLNSIIGILKNAQEANLRIEAAKVLGGLALAPELVLPALERALWFDKSIVVKEAIPKFMINYGKEAVKYLKEVLSRGQPNVRLNAIKALGRIKSSSEEIITLLTKELPKTDATDEIFWLSLSLISLQGIDCEANKTLQKLIENEEISPDQIFHYKHMVNNLEVIENRKKLDLKKKK